MMLYSPEKINQKCPEECWREVSWYLVDSVGNIANVSSGGGLLPDSIASLPEEKLIAVDDYFNALPEIADEVFFSEKYVEIINAEGNLKFKDGNIKAMRRFILKGLFAFDKARLTNYDDFEYFMQAKPNKKLTLNDIDKDIAQIIKRTFVNINFDIDSTFFVNQIA